MSAVFVHDEAQQELAEQKKAEWTKMLGSPIHTKILPAGPFYLAEDYHQKYALRSQRQLLQEFEAIYPQLEDFVNSTAVSRVNGFVNGYGSQAQLQSEIAEYGLSSKAQDKLEKQARRYWR